MLGTLIGEWRALVVGHLSARDSMKGTLREGSFTGEPKDEVLFLDICKVPCKWVCLPIGSIFGEPGGGSFAGAFKRK